MHLCANRRTGRVKKNVCQHTCMYFFLKPQYGWNIENAFYTGLVWVLVCQVKGVRCVCVWVWKREGYMYHLPTLSLEHLLPPEATPTRLQGGRQVNEKLLILPLYPRRSGEATLILPNFVFLFFWRPVHSVATPGLWGWEEQRLDLCERWGCQQRKAR